MKTKLGIMITTLLLLSWSVSAQEADWQLDLSLFDSSGAPLETAEPPIFSEGFYDDIVAAIPERQNMVYLHPEYFTTANTGINLIHDAQEVKITFLHEGAGYKNSFGYVTYTEGNEPQTVNDLKERGIFVFPNASLSGSGGNLSFGDTVSIGEHPKGTKLLFFIVSDGWMNGSIRDTDWIFTTNQSLNPEPATEKMNNIPIQQHVAMLWHEASKLIVLGFEDIYRTGGDHDFNDVVFTVSSTPSSAIDSSQFVTVPEDVPDANDSYHYYPAMDQTGVLAYEDLWPKKGDFDFNDVVIEYYVIETRNNGLITKIQYDITPLAMGASFSNALRLKLNTPPSNIKSLRKAYDGKIWDLIPVEDGEGSIIEITENVKGIIPPPTGYSMSNTIKNSPAVVGKKITIIMQFNSGIAPESLDDPPYNTYISRSDGLGGLIEIHLPDYPPTGQANLTLFNSGDDDSNFATGRYYKTSENLPWAIHIPNSWKNPLERKSIEKGYPNIIPWATSGGEDDNDWYLVNIQTLHLY